MVAKKRKVIWDEEARAYFRKAIAYIRKDSAQNAEKNKERRTGLYKSINGCAGTQYAPDKYRKNNEGGYRAYELHKYRISYFVSEDEIRIVRIRHTGQEPKEY